MSLLKSPEPPHAAVERNWTCQLCNEAVESQRPSDVNECEHTRLREQLKCPVCFEVALPPVRQCKNGHVLCDECASLCSKCPTCREAGQPNGRNLALEKLAALLEMKCKYCMEVIRYECFTSHSKECELRPHNLTNVEEAFVPRGPHAADEAQPDVAYRVPQPELYIWEWLIQRSDNMLGNIPLIVVLTTILSSGLVVVVWLDDGYSRRLAAGLLIYIGLFCALPP